MDATGSEPRTAAIFFADIMNSSQMSESLGLEQYGKVVDQFQSLSQSVLPAVLSYWGFQESEVETTTVGDEFKVFIAPLHEDQEALPRAVAALVELGLRLKIAWLASDNNTNRLKEDKAPTDLGIGIHVGPVMVSLDKSGRPHCEGYAINLGKRVEGTSREGKCCRIVLSSVAHLFLSRGAGFMLDTAEMPRIEMKGILEPPRLFEIVGSEFRNDDAILARILRDIDFATLERLSLLSGKAMNLSRQMTWYGLLCVALLFHRGFRTQDRRLFEQAAGLAESILRQEYSACLCRFLGCSFEGWNPDKGVVFNRKALKLDPLDYFAQFNLAVALSHTRDIPEESGGQSLTLRRQTLEEYKNAEHIAKAHGFLGLGTEADWKLPLFQAHVLARMARQSLLERTSGRWPVSAAFSEQEKYLIALALSLYERASAELLKPGREAFRARWYGECLRYYGETLEMSQQAQAAASKYDELLSVAANSEDPTVQDNGSFARSRLQVLRPSKEG